MGTRGEADPTLIHTHTHVCTRTHPHARSSLTLVTTCDRTELGDGRRLNSEWNVLAFVLGATHLNYRTEMDFVTLKWLLDVLLPMRVQKSYEACLNFHPGTREEPAPEKDTNKAV